MGVLRTTEKQFDDVRRHLAGSQDERFAFLLCDTTTSSGTPIFIAKETILVPDGEISLTRTGWELSDKVLDDVLNQAVRGHLAIVEAHFHGGTRPRFSRTDRRGLGPMAHFALERLDGRPYGATVWGDDSVYGEVFLLDSAGRVSTSPLRSCTVVGGHLRQVVSRDDAPSVGVTHDRQAAWFGPLGQRELALVRVAIVGLGGTGSHAATQLAHLGVRDFVLVDGDMIEESNLNRTVTASFEDVGKSKANVAAKRIHDIVPSSAVSIVTRSCLHGETIDTLVGVDIIFGCVDNDGARLVLNRLGLAYRIPYIDVATDILVNDEGLIAAAGGRAIAVLTKGPCLACMGELDANEARSFLSSPADQALAARAGYATNLLGTSPSVVFLNGLAASTLVAEFAVLLSTVRDVVLCSDIDLQGLGRTISGTWITPRRVTTAGDCIECAYGDTADSSNIRKEFGGLTPLARPSEGDPPRSEREGAVRPRHSSNKERRSQ